ncbi:MAG: ribosome recycling factor [Clostridia bacterium]
MKEQLKLCDEKMKKCIASLDREFDTVRAGRANPTVLDRISIDYFGAQTPLNQIGSISSPDPRTLVIQPWDTSILRDIEKAIQLSDLGLNPQNDGKIIRLAFPPLSAERRKEMVKLVSKYAEEAKVAVRNVRRDTIDKFKDMKKKSEITEDDLKSGEKDVQTLTDKNIKEIDSLAAKKEKELLEV